MNLIRIHGQYKGILYDKFIDLIVITLIG